MAQRLNTNYPADNYVPDISEATTIDDSGTTAVEQMETKPPDNYVPDISEATTPTPVQKWGESSLLESAAGGLTQGVYLQGAPEYAALIPAKFHNLINNAISSIQAAPALMPGGKTYQERKKEIIPQSVSADYSTRVEEMRDYYEWLKESNPKVHMIANMAGTALSAATLGTLMKLAKIPAASAPYVERLIFPIQSFIEGFNAKRGDLPEKIQSGGQFAITHSAFSRGQEVGAEALQHLSKTGVGKKIGKGVDNLFDWISKKVKPKAEEAAFLSTKPTVKGVTRLEKLPGGAAFVTKEGDVILDPKIKDLGRTLLDNGIIDSNNPWHKVSDPEKMYSKLLLSKHFWGKKKQKIIQKLDLEGKSPFNPNELADEIENTFGAKIREKATRQDLITRYEQVITELRQLDKGKTGQTTFKKANVVIGEWWQDIHRATGDQKRGWTGAEQVRQFVKKKLDSAFDNVSVGTARINREYHNLSILKDYLSNLKARGQLGKLNTQWWKKVVGATVLGTVGVAGAISGHPILGATGVTLLGLGAWSQKHGNQASAKLLEQIRHKSIRIEGLTSIDNILRNSINRGEQSFIATHSLLYKKYPEYKEAVKELNEEIKKPEKENEKTPDSVINK